MDEKERKKLIREADDIIHSDRDWQARSYDLVDSDRDWQARSYDLVEVAYKLGLTPMQVMDGKHRDMALAPVKAVVPIALQPLIISAPFGNYQRFQLTHSTPTLGTFTLKKRAGVLKRLWRILRTLRYRRGVGWINKLGLPNPGIEWLLEQTDPPDPAIKPVTYGVENKIVSIAVTTGAGAGAHELKELLRKCEQLHPAPMAVEYNAGCPNVGPHLDARRASHVLAGWKMPKETRLIVKLPPVDYEETMYEFSEFADYFHCCNTLPIAGGGLSGPALRPLVRRALKDAKKIAPGVKLIAGGGVVDITTAEAYLGHGADHVAIASMLLNPWNRTKALQIAEKLRGE